MVEGFGWRSWIGMMMRGCTQCNDGSVEVELVGGGKPGWDNQRTGLSYSRSLAFTIMVWSLLSALRSHNSTSTNTYRRHLSQESAQRPSIVVRRKSLPNCFTGRHYVKLILPLIPHSLASICTQRPSIRQILPLHIFHSAGRLDRST